MNAHQPSITVAVKADTSQLARTARIIARHLPALADELEAPDGIITFDGDLTDEQVAEFKARFIATQAQARPERTQP